MPEIKIFSTPQERRKFMKGKKFIWFVCLEYKGRQGTEYWINFII